MAIVPMAPPKTATPMKESQAFVSRQIGDENILVPISQSSSEVECVYTLNNVAAEIWELLDGDHSLSDILEVIESEFNVDKDKARIDLLKFIQELESIKAVKK